jgi:hypothetical protein
MSVASPAGGAGPRKTWKETAAVIYDKVAAQWFIWGIGLAIGLAAAWPALGKKDGIIQAQYSVKYTAVIIIFLCTGMSLKTRVLVTAVAHLRAHLVTQVRAAAAACAPAPLRAALPRAPASTPPPSPPPCRRPSAWG